MGFGFEEEGVKGGQRREREREGREARTDGIHDQAHFIQLLGTNVGAVGEAKLIPIQQDQPPPPGLLVPGEKHPKLT